MYQQAGNLSIKRRTWGTKYLKYQWGVRCSSKIISFSSKNFGIIPVFPENLVKQRWKIGRRTLWYDIYCVRVIILDIFGICRWKNDCYMQGCTTKKFYVRGFQNSIFFVYKYVIFTFSVLFRSIWPFLQTTFLLGVHEIGPWSFILSITRWKNWLL